MSLRAVALRLEGPMQSWGGPVAGDTRTTLDFPTKSGVIGIIASCLGVDRQDVASLAALHAGFAVGVRIDEPGRRAVDYQTVFLKGEDKNPTITPRAYLYDASFTALVVERETPANTRLSIDAVASALRVPRFAPYLGRRACPPSAPLRIRDADGVLEGADWPWLFGRIGLGDLAHAVQHRPDDRAERLDAYIEGDVPGALRRLRVRDEFTGPLARGFHERLLSHLRLDRPESRSFAEGRDTTEEWTA